VDDACPIPGRTSKTISIIVNPAPEAGHTAVVGDCGEVTFTAFKTAQTGGNYQYTWSGDGANGSRFFSQNAVTKYKYNKGGTYYYSLYVFDPTTGCDQLYSDSVKIADYVEVHLPKDTSICAGSTLHISSTRAKGKAPYTYLWNTGATTDNLTVKVTQDAAYVLTIHDGTGCENYDTIKVHAQIPPQPNLGKNIRVCAGDTVKLDTKIKGIKSYLWSKILPTGPVLMTKTPVLAVVDSGRYAVFLTDTVGCTGTDTVNVFFNTQVKANGGPRNGCANLPLLLQAGTGGNEYEWWNLALPKSRNPVGTGPTYLIPKLLGNMLMTVRIKRTYKGVTCQDFDTIYVYYNPLPIVKAGKLPPQCQNAQALDLNRYGTPAPGSVGNHDGVWYYKGQELLGNSIFPPKMGPGSFRLKYTFTDANGCSSSDSTFLVIDSVPQVLAGKDTNICTGDGVYSLHGIPSGGTWSSLPEGDPGLKGSTFDPVKAGAGVHTLVYRYFSTTSAKCDNSDTVIYIVHTTPVVKAGTYGPYCSGDNIAYLGGTPSGGVWSVGAGVDPSLLVQDGPGAYHFEAKKAGSGKYWLKYTGFADGKFCGVTDSTQLEVSVSPVIDSVYTDIHKRSFCSSTIGTIKLKADVHGPRTGPGEKFVYSGDGVAGDAFSPSIAGAGTHRITLNYTDALGCKDTNYLDIIVSDPPTAKILTNPQLCEQQQYNISASYTHARNLYWYVQNHNSPMTVDSSGAAFVGADTGANIVFKPRQSDIDVGGFTLIATTNEPGNPCEPARVVVPFTINPLPVVNFSTDVRAGCEPLAVPFVTHSTIDQGIIVSYVWYFGDGDSSVAENPVHVYRKAGLYTVRLKAYSEKGCVSEKSITNYINVYPTPVADFNAKPQYTTISLPQIKFENASTGVDENTKYFWRFGDLHKPGGGTSTEKNPEYTYSDTGRYTVSLVATSSNGCRDTVEKLNYIDIRPEIIVFIPNVFRPGYHGKETGKNEKFSVVATAISNFEMLVYNRWGELMYDTHDLNAGWDGTYKGEPAEEGVYVYVVKCVSLAGKSYTYTGTVTLIK
jgi:gliding motility-associated-like protein